MDGTHVEHDTPIDLPAEPSGESVTPPPAADAAPAEPAASAPATEAPGESASELKDRWLRAEAELQNYRRRAARDLEEARRNAEESVMFDVIESLDDLERALAAVPADGAGEAWAAGVKLVAQRLRDGLARRGVSVVDPAGEPFDPAFHDALLQMPAPEGVAPGTVLQVALRGYRRGDRALRAARVVVARAADGEA